MHVWASIPCAMYSNVSTMYTSPPQCHDATMPPPCITTTLTYTMCQCHYVSCIIGIMKHVSSAPWVMYHAWSSCMWRNKLYNVMYEMNVRGNQNRNIIACKREFKCDVCDVNETYTWVINVHVSACRYIACVYTNANVSTRQTWKIHNSAHTLFMLSRAPFANIMVTMWSNANHGVDVRDVH